MNKKKEGGGEGYRCEQKKKKRNCPPPIIPTFIRELGEPLQKQKHLRRVRQGV